MAVSFTKVTGEKQVYFVLEKEIRSSVLEQVSLTYLLGICVRYEEDKWRYNLEFRGEGQVGYMILGINM